MSNGHQPNKSIENPVPPQGGSGISSPVQKLRDAIEFRLHSLRQSYLILSNHNELKANLEFHGYEARIDELESFLEYLKKEVET